MSYFAENGARKVKKHLDFTARLTSEGWTIKARGYYCRLPHARNQAKLAYVLSNHIANAHPDSY